MWGDLWTYPFLASVWGTVSSWFGVLGTVASIGTAAYYYVRNQKLEEYAQARHVSFVTEVSDEAGFRARVFNFSDESIFDVMFCQERTLSFREVLERDARKYAGHRVSDKRVAELREDWSNASLGEIHVPDHDKGHIRPGGSLTFVFRGPFSAVQDYSVNFRDSMARDWCMDLDISVPHRVHPASENEFSRRRDRIFHPVKYFRHLSKERRTRRWLDQHAIEEGR